MKALFQSSAIGAVMKQFMLMSDEAIIATLYYLGEGFVNRCKLEGNYKDRTGNLRSSIGCVVLKNGEIVRSLHYGTNDEGENLGLDFADELAAQFSKGIHLIVYAGMHYALYVENMNSYSVLTSYLPGSAAFGTMLKDLL